MNAARTALMQQARQSNQESRLESRKLNSVFVPPKRREVDTLVDWISDHPSAKSSRSLRMIQDAYLESLGIL